MYCMPKQNCPSIYKQECSTDIEFKTLDLIHITLCYHVNFLSWTYLIIINDVSPLKRACFDPVNSSESTMKSPLKKTCRKNAL